MGTPFDDFNNQIQYKFIRDTPKPYATRNKSFVIPSYSDIHSTTNSLRTFPANNGMILEKSLPTVDKLTFTPNVTPIDASPSTTSLDNPATTLTLTNETINKETIVFNCRNIHAHILNCPVCSKIYKMNQNNLILLVVILILILLILIKYLMK